MRFAFLLLMLLAETVVLRLRFDVRVLKIATGWWSGLLAGPSAPARVGIAFFAAVLVIGGLRLRSIAREFRAHADGHRRWWLWFALHLVFFAATFALAARVAGNSAQAASPVWWNSGGALLAAAALAFWIASIAPASYWLYLLRAERAGLLAGCAVAAAAWYVGEWTQGAWVPLNEGTFFLVERLLGLIYPEIITIPEQRIIGPPQFPIVIGEDCSGYEGIGLICVFLAAFFWVFRNRLRFPEAWLLWPIGIVGIWLCNAVRIAALVMVGTFYSRDVAIRGFHSQAGWLFFNLVALSLMAIALKTPFLVRSSAIAAPRPRATPAAAYMIPFLALIATNMVVAAFSGDFDWLYPLKVVVTVAVLWRFRAVYQALDWSWSWGAAINGCLVFVVWIALARDEGAVESDVALGVQTLSPLAALVWLTFRTAGSVLTVPLVEELAFRGYLLRRFVAVDFDEVAYERAPLWAVFVSSLLFGLMHGRWLAGMFAGLCYAYAARRRDKLCDAVTAHAVTNALIAADVLLTGAWWLW